jgi:hypothetical protein
MRTNIEGGVMPTTKNRPHRCFRTTALVASALSAMLVACSIDTPDIDDDDDQKKTSSSSGGPGLAGSGGNSGGAQGSGAAGGGTTGSGPSSGPGGSGGAGGSGGGPSAQEICEVGCANVYYCGLCIVDANDQCVDEATCTQSCLQDQGLQDAMYCAATVETCEDLANCNG